MARFRTITHRKKAFLITLIAAVMALLLCLICYVMNNFPLFTGESLDQYAWAEWVFDHNTSEKGLGENCVLVNLTYDKQLVTVLDEYGFEKGNVDITDREKLLNLLQMLNSTKTYRYIFLDVRFEKNIDSPQDSALFTTICSMKNIVIATHADMEISDSILFKKTGISDYYSTITATNFIRYEFLHDNKLSMPLMAYHELTGRKITRHGIFYTDNSNLCQNSLFLKFPLRDFSEYDKDGNKIYYNLGADLLANYDEESLAELVKNKDIIIGDFIEDRHDTYAGLQPGSVILYTAFQSLMKGEHIVKPIVIILEWILFTVIITTILSRWSLVDKVVFIQKRKFLSFLVSLIGYSFVLALFSHIVFLSYGMTIIVVLPSFIFAFLKHVVKFKK